MAPQISEILDTNVLLRFLVGDNPGQKEQAGKWFAEGKTGKRKIIVAPLIIAEIIFVLESFYKKSRADIVNALEIFLSQRWLQVEEREVLQAALPFYKNGDHFVDSYLRGLSQVKHISILSFDKKLQKRATA